MNTSIVLFLLITLVYFFLKYKFFNSSYTPIITSIYLLLLLIIQFWTSALLIQSKCNSINYATVFFSSIVPWFFIIGLMIALLIVFPSWKAPFSNTFGYGLTLLGGIRTLLIKKILKSPSNENTTYNDAIREIYSDPSLIINEITPNNFEIFWSKMSPLFQENANLFKESMFKLVILKDLCSEFLWYLLAGLLAISLGYQYLLNAKCDRSVEELEKSQNEINTTIKENEEESNNVKTYSFD